MMALHRFWNIKKRPMRKQRRMGHRLLNFPQG